MHLSRYREICALIVLLLPGCAPAPPSNAVTVAAAASLTNALNDVLAERMKEGGARLRVGGTDFLARQIAIGSDADVFIAADERWMDYLAERGCVGHAQILCRNGLVLVTRPGLTYSLESIDGRLAIADPDTVPAGRYAKQVLESLGLWDRLKPRMVWAGDVRMALAFVERGAVDAAIVYGTDAKATKGVRVARMFDASRHDPIVYPIAPVTSSRCAGESAALIAYLMSDDARPAFVRYGFEVGPR